MYMPPAFEESRTDAMHDLMQAYPFATVVSSTEHGIDANHLPLHLSRAEGPHGVLRGHVARANPLWRESAGSPALIIFHGPASYISPNWYPTKQEHGKVVPTWNYAVVHARGVLHVIDDPVWLRSQLEKLTSEHEAAFLKPWALADAPSEFTDRLLTAVVGIEIVITSLSGKWKVSQNQPEQNQAGVVRGLTELGTDAAREMAALVASRSTAKC